MAATKADPGKETTGFAVFLASTRPKTDAELGDELRTLVQAVKDTGKAGTISLTISVKPIDGGTEVVSINDQIKVKKPEFNRLPSMAYVDRVNNLKRTDPNQMPLFDNEEDIQTIDLATGEVKEGPTA
jgi:hypothetical protein